MCTKEKLPIDQDFLFVLVLSPAAGFACFCEYCLNFWIAIRFYNNPKQLN